MSTRAPTLLLLRSRDADRIREALRAALGLTLRGRPVRIYSEIEIGRAELPSDGQRHMSTLDALGVQVRPLRELKATQLAAAHAVEVWS